MKMDDMIIISIDDHVSEPRDMFKRHLPPELQDKAPQLKHVDGADYWVYEGVVRPNPGRSAVVSRRKDGFLSVTHPSAAMRLGN